MKTDLAAVPPPDFVVPRELLATEPPEARGLRRDEVKLLVASGVRLEHARFADLDGYLRAGDLVVVNNSATIPAAVDGQRSNGTPVVVHFSTELEDGTWTVELRTPDGATSVRDATPSETIAMARGLTIQLLDSFGPEATQHTRLWLARALGDADVKGLMARWGRPISYGYLTESWPLSTYQTIFAQRPGSAEMPSAARPFTGELVARMTGRGIGFGTVTLHSGVSSLELGERPQPEQFDVPAITARLVNETHREGGRVIAVGTTVARALETVAAPDGSVRASQGWTQLVLGPQRPMRTVNGLITGWHPPDATHLLLLEALVREELVKAVYDEALERRYRWHEFGDSLLILPAP